MTIIHQVAVSVGDNLWDRGVCCSKSGIVSAYGDQGACNLMDIVAASTYVGDIFRGSDRVGPITALKCELKLREENIDS